MIEIKINEKDVAVKEGSTIMEAAEEHGVFIPHFCYHKKLSIAANCRMCLVEVEKSRKPLPACATPVTQGMKVFTDSKVAKSAQESVMEFLLINHPLDCPICDQGGECQLQDLSVGYGKSNSQFKEEKRVVFHKSLGDLISAEEMTRCIHCTRCVRFGEEVAGIKELGMPGRGEHSEITSYLGNAIESELSGNMIDICPVGALTSKPFRYTARTWELEKTRAVSNHDGLGCNLNVQAKKNQVMRVLPFQNDTVNECWISDRDRFSYEGLMSDDRLKYPLIRDENGLLVEASWENAFKKAVNLVEKSDRLNGLISGNSSIEEMSLFASLLRGLGSDNIDFRNWLTDPSFDKKIGGVPSLNCSLEDIKKLDNILIFGSRLRDDCPLLAQKIRWGINNNGTNVWQLSSYNQEILGDEEDAFLVSPKNYEGFLSSLLSFIDGEHENSPTKSSHNNSFEKLVQSFSSSKKDGVSLVLVGMAVLSHPKATRLIMLCKKIVEKLGCKLGFVTSGGNFVGGYLANCLPKEKGLNAAEMFDNKSSCYLVSNLDLDADFFANEIARTAFERNTVISFSSFKSSADKYADVIFPISSCFETEGSFVNMEGRLQQSAKVVEPPGEAKELWKVLRVFASYLGLKMLEFDSLLELRSTLVPELTKEKVLQLQELKFKNGEFKSEGEMEIKKANELEAFHYVPIYSSDPVVRRASSLQKTPLANGPSVLFNPQDILARGIENGKTVTLDIKNSVGRRKYSLVASTDKNVAPGVVAILGGKLGSDSISGSIMGLES